MPDCWPWNGQVNRKGHGYYWDGNTTVMAHRAWWETKNGPVPAGKQLHHSCLNPSCVNPDHLVPMTAFEHRQEHRRIRGRYDHGKLSDADISSMRMLRSELGVKQSELAWVYGVRQHSISRAISGCRRKGML